MRFLPVALALLSFTGMARAQTPASSPEALYEQCKAQFRLRLYADAIATCKQAYLEGQDPRVLVTIANAYTQIGDPDDAIHYYQNFLDVMGPTYPPEKRAQIEQVIDAQRQKQRATPSRTAAAPTSQTASSQAPLSARVPPPAPPEALPWYRNQTGLVLIGTGVATAAAGTALLFVGRATDANAAGAGTLDAFQAERTRGKIEYWAGLGAVGVGAAVAASGVAWGMTHSAKSPLLALALGPRCATILLSWAR